MKKLHSALFTISLSTMSLVSPAFSATGTEGGTTTVIEGTGFTFSTGQIVTQPVIAEPFGAQLPVAQPAPVQPPAQQQLAAQPPPPPPPKAPNNTGVKRKVSAYCKFAYTLPEACMSEAEKATWRTRIAIAGGAINAGGLLFSMTRDDILTADQKLKEWELVLNGGQFDLPQAAHQFYGAIKEKECKDWAVANLVPDKQRRKRDFPGCDYGISYNIIYDLVPVTIKTCAPATDGVTALYASAPSAAAGSEMNLTSVTDDEGTQLECAEIEEPGVHFEGTPGTL